MNTRFPNDQEIKRKAEAAQALEADRVRLLIEQPFIGAILIRQNLIPVADSRCPTASTDGQNIFVNPDFYLPLSPAERRFLLAHEVWHTVFLHFLRRNGRDIQLFNIATDMEINWMLLNEKFQVINGALLPPDKWKGLNAEQIYERLLKQKRRMGSPLDVHLEPGTVSGTGSIPVDSPDSEKGKSSGPRKKKNGKSSDPQSGSETVIDTDFRNFN